jgi:hypothetical protein
MHRWQCVAGPLPEGGSGSGSSHDSVDATTGWGSGPPSLLPSLNPHRAC